MLKYFITRIIKGILSIIAVIIIVMFLIYTLMDREQIFVGDTVYQHQANNAQIRYKYEKMEIYGYIDFVNFTEFVDSCVESDGLSAEEAVSIKTLAKKQEDNSEKTKEYIERFKEKYRGYEMVYLNARMSGSRIALGGNPYCFVYRDVPIISRVFTYFKNIIKIDNIHKAKGIEDSERGIKLVLNDPAYGGKKFSPAIMGTGTNYKYLLYFDNRAPFIHQNLVRINLGVSYSINKNKEILLTMTEPQGSLVQKSTIYPTGIVVNTSDNIHTLSYVEGSYSDKIQVIYERFVDDYTNCSSFKNGKSRMAYSFVIGIIAVIAAYILGIPLGLIMARNKDGVFDKIGTMYIIFIIAVPSLAYIFMFKGIGVRLFKLPSTFDVNAETKLMYILPIVSLALPSVANLMKWIRRYMIDQMNSDYVKFARSGGLSENEIFSKHILKNAIIPIVHGIPGSVLGAIVGAIITERVYSVPGIGQVLTEAINAYDNGVIVGVTLFYAVISVTSVILGDLLMATVDPRISFVSKKGA